MEKSVSSWNSFECITKYHSLWDSNTDFRCLIQCNLTIIMSLILSFSSLRSLWKSINREPRKNIINIWLVFFFEKGRNQLTVCLRGKIKFYFCKYHETVLHHDFEEIEQYLFLLHYYFTMLMWNSHSIPRLLC